MTLQNITEPFSPETYFHIPLILFYLKACPKNLPIVIDCNKIYDILFKKQDVNMATKNSAMKKTSKFTMHFKSLMMHLKRKATILSISLPDLFLVMTNII